MNQDKVSQFIKDIRKKNNLTQKDLASKYGVTYQAVSKWENGKNLPDMFLLKQMSEDFNVSLDEILDGKYNNRSNKNNYFLYMIPIIILLLILVLYFILFRDDNFKFKTLESTCNNFDISGSVSYNRNKSAIYISNIKYCGKDIDVTYKKIDCTLYEKYNDTIKKISSYNEDDITLKEFLDNVTFKVDNYSRACKEFSKNSFYLEINATDLNDKITTYKISLSLEDDC